MHPQDKEDIAAEVIYQAVYTTVALFILYYAIIAIGYIFFYYWLFASSWLAGLGYTGTIQMLAPIVVPLSIFGFIHEVYTFIKNPKEYFIKPLLTPKEIENKERDRMALRAVCRGILFLFIVGILTAVAVYVSKLI